MSERINVGQAPVGFPQGLASGEMDVANSGAEVLLKRIVTDDFGHAYAENLAFFVNGASRLVKFRIRIGGVLLPGDFYDRNTIFGEIGNPRQLTRPIPIPPGSTFEIYAVNTDAASLPCECDGEVNYYAKPLR